MNAEERHKRQQQLASVKPYEGYGEEKVNWYIDIPKRLALEFDRLFPDRGSHVILVVTAVAYAVRKGPAALDKLYEELNDSVQGDQQRDLHGDDREPPATTEDGPKPPDLN